MDIRILTYQSTSAAGQNMERLRESIDAQASGLCKNDMPGSDVDTWIGKVPGLDDMDLGEWQSRNNALAELGFRQGDIESQIEDLKSRYGAHRLGLVVGSSTSSIDRTEEAYCHLANGELAENFRQARVHNPNGPALYLAHRSGISGPAVTINTACSSSAKAFATGARWLNAGLVDAVLVGGVDTLCLSVIHGFHSLQLVSPNPCKPLDKHRNGINLGEAAGFAILVRANEQHADSGITLRGFGESSDAHHMSHPHPDGLGARHSMLDALRMADFNPSAVDYINLHGTSSRANDLIEGTLIAELFPTSRVSSTKAWTGHTLGAAGITEALLTVDALLRNIAPGTLNLTELDDGIVLNTSSENCAMPLQLGMTNSFGFGGNNCSLVFEKHA
ncbi:MAG: beta-ketoacyl-ACP synthase [Congregibacter sp.]